MIKVEVIEEFTLGKFDELKNIQRKNKNTEGRLYVGDIFECNQDMADYLTGENKLNRAFVKVIEVIPEEKLKKTEKKTILEEEPKKVEKRKRTKTIAKK